MGARGGRGADPRLDRAPRGALWGSPPGERPRRSTAPPAPRGLFRGRWGPARGRGRGPVWGPPSRAGTRVLGARASGTPSGPVPPPRAALPRTPPPAPPGAPHGAGPARAARSIAFYRRRLSPPLARRRRRPAELEPRPARRREPRRVLVGGADGSVAGAGRGAVWGPGRRRARPRGRPSLGAQSRAARGPGPRRHRREPQGHRPADRSHSTRGAPHAPSGTRGIARP